MSRNSILDFARVCQLAQEARLQITTAHFDGINFGFWQVELRNKGEAVRQITWEARDRWFCIQTRQSDGSWANDEVIKESQAVVLDDLIKRLAE